MRGSCCRCAGAATSVCCSPLVIVRKRSCPAVSHICSFTHLLSRKIFLILKSILQFDMKTAQQQRSSTRCDGVTHCAVPEAGPMSKTEPSRTMHWLCLPLQRLCCLVWLQIYIPGEPLHFLWLSLAKKAHARLKPLLPRTDNLCLAHMQVPDQCRRSLSPYRCDEARGEGVL